MARDGDVFGWDPIHPNDNNTIWALALVYHGLTRNDPDGKTIRPSLAESWQVSPDGKTYTFTLRNGVKFSDGSPIKASDVLFSFNRYMTDSNSTQRQTFPEGIKLAAPDERTFIMQLVQPWPSFLAERGPIGIFPEAYVKQVGGDGMAAKPLGAGPFVLGEWRKGDRIVLTRNSNYWDAPKPYLDEVDFVIIPDDNTRALKLQAGEIDIASLLAASQVDRLKSTSGLSVLAAETMAADIIRLNEKVAPFQDQNVRLALNYAVEKAAIIKAVLFGFATPANSILPNLKYPPSPDDPYPYDVAKAKDMLAKSKYPKGFDAKLLITSGDQVASGIATIVKSQLGAIGINVTLQPLEVGALTAAGNNEQYDMWLAQYTADFPDPELIFRFAAYGGKFTDAMHTHYLNPQVNQLFDQSTTEVDTTKREQMYKQMQQMVWSDASDLFLIYPQLLYGVRQNVHDFALQPTSHYRMEDVWKS